MPSDLTAILLPAGQRTPDEIRAAVAARGLGEHWLRIAPLDAVGLVQVEVLDGRRGLPSEDPELVSALSTGGRAAFVHVNHTAKQAMVHGFTDGTAKAGWAGQPGADFEEKLIGAIGHELAAITGADDGTRLGIGIAASHTAVVVRGRALAVPVGTPTGLDSFRFHDRGAERDEGTRLSLFVYDADEARLAFSAPARELAARLLERGQSVQHAGAHGPLEGARAGVVDALAKIADRPLEPGDEPALRALELCALDAAYAFAGGDRQYFWDHRVLPMFTLGEGPPVFDPEEMEALEDSDSILEAMVDVLPYAAPPSGEGALLQNLGDDEVGPLAPWARPGEEYAGAIFRLQPGRLLGLVRSLDGNQLGAHIEKFERAWYRAARPAQPEGDAFELWRRAKAEEGQRDVERFLTDWAELRLVLELAEANRLAVGLLFYE